MKDGAGRAAWVQMSQSLGALLLFSTLSLNIVVPPELGAQPTNGDEFNSSDDPFEQDRGSPESNGGGGCIDPIVDPQTGAQLDRFNYTELTNGRARDGLESGFYSTCIASCAPRFVLCARQTGFNAGSDQFDVNTNDGFNSGGDDFGNDLPTRNYNVPPFTGGYPIPNDPTCIPPDNLTPLQRFDWLHRHCATHGYISNDPSREPEQREFEIGDPVYWTGFRDGMQECLAGLGELAFRLDDVIASMRDGNFTGAAQLLGVGSSDSGIKSLVASMENLVKEFNSGRSTPLPGQPIPDSYSIGKHGAERFCFWTVLPSAQKCVMKGGMCVARSVMNSCEKIVEKVASLRKVRKPRLQPVSPIFRGMLLEDEKYLQTLAVTEGKTFFVRDSNRQALRWVGRDGYKPKPMEVKGKTLKESDFTGASPGDAEKYAGLASAKGMSLEERSALLKKGYSIGSPGEYETIRSPDGSKFYSDVDLHGVYNLDGTNGWSPELLQKLQCRFFDRGIQHGPHDLWPDRNIKAVAGPNYGPQIGNGKTITAIYPDGTMQRIETLAQLKEAYAAAGVNFKQIYPKH